MAAISSVPVTCMLGFRRGLPNRMEAPPLQYFGRLSPSRPVRRLTTATGLQLKKHGVVRFSAFASDTPNSNTSKEGKSSKSSSKSSSSSSSSSGSNPPLLTILAGLVVFLFVLWVLSSLCMWLVGLILHPPSR